MNYTVVPSKAFIKVLKKQKKSGRKDLLKVLPEVLALLAAQDERSAFTLGTRWRDHALKGDKHGIRELHLTQNDLLLYTIDDELKIIKLHDIVNHEELRKM